MGESIADAFPDVPCPLCGETMRLCDRGGEAEWEASYLCGNQECGIEIVIEFDRDSRGYQVDRPKPGFLAKLARRTPPPATAELLKWLREHSDYGIQACYYGVLERLGKFLAEWPEPREP